MRSDIFSGCSWSAVDLKFRDGEIPRGIPDPKITCEPITMTIELTNAVRVDGRKSIGTLSENFICQPLKKSSCDRLSRLFKKIA